MKPTSVLFIAIGLGLVLNGCAHKPQQTSAVQVESPSDRPAPPPKPPALQPPPSAPIPKPLPGTGRLVSTKSGLKYRDIKIGRGAEAKPGKIVTVHYRGWLDNGTEFDSSRKRNQPFTFTLGRGEVIRGWDEGVAGMRVGGVRELTIPPNLAYGHEGKGSIPPDSTLHFEVELLGVGG